MSGRDGGDRGAGARPVHVFPEAPRPVVGVLVDGRAGGEALATTIRVVDALVAQSEASAAGVVVTGPFVVGAPEDLARLPERRAFPIETTAGAAMAAAVNAMDPAELVLHVAAGLTPTLAAIDHLVERLEHHHVAAVAATVVGGDGGAVAPPAGLALTGHPVRAEGSLLPVADGDPTMFLGDAHLVRRVQLHRAGNHDHRFQQPTATLDLAWRLWTSSSGIVVDTLVPIGGHVAPVDEGRPGTSDAVTTEVDALRMVHGNVDSYDHEGAFALARRLSPLRLAADGIDVPSAAVSIIDAEQGALDDERALRQQRRYRTDPEIARVMRSALVADRNDPAFLAAHAEGVDALGPATGFGPRRRIVIATRDALAPRMAGPGIRALHLAEAMAAHHEVRLVSVMQADLTHPAFSIELIDPSEVADLVEWCDIFVFQGSVMAGQDCFERTDRIFAIDIYDPMHLEQLEQSRDHVEHERRKAVNAGTRTLNESLLRGDFFFCASERQRDLWLGHLASLGRINVHVYDADPTMRDFIDVVSFGIPSEPPVRSRRAIKGAMPGVGLDDRVIIWGGGVYNWFDPLTLIRAVDRLRARVPDVRLVFLGMKHPNPEIPEMKMAVAARKLAVDLGIAGSHVIFNEEWVAYEDRHNYLLDADVGATTHLHHIETEFAYRTRVLDYLWAGLPTVATSGDALADLIEARDLGITVPPNDVEALTEALGALLDDPERAARCRANIAEVSKSLTWPVVTEPLVRFCDHPSRSPDLVAGVIDRHGVMGTDPPAVPAWRRYLQVAKELVQQRDAEAIARRGKRFLRSLPARLLGKLRPAK